jgi:molybdopterin-guanine dinucleotide biosynthesis protein A
VTCAGVLLTGGTSRRMGTDKATLVIDGETLAARAARVLSAVCEPVIEVGPGVSDLAHVREDPPGAGPLAALMAGAGALDANVVLLLACDLPFVGAPVLRLLAEWPGTRSAIPVVGDRFQYACARYGPAALDEARVVLRRGGSSLKAIAEVDCDHVPETAWRAVGAPNSFADIDTPDDMHRLGLT